MILHAKYFGLLRPYLVSFEHLIVYSGGSGGMLQENKCLKSHKTSVQLYIVILAGGLTAMHVCLENFLEI